MAEIGKPKEDWQVIKDKYAGDIYDIITNQKYYSSKPFTSQDLNPDLIIRWRVPQLTHIKRDLFAHVSTFVNLPQEQLEEAFSVAEKKVMSEMQKAKENQDTSDIQFRLQTSIVDRQQKQKLVFLEHDNEETEELKFRCFDQKLGLLDGFTLYFNSFVYILQKRCGFQVRAFILHKNETQIGGYLGEITDFIGVTKILKGFGLGSEVHVRDVYLFLSLSLQNMMRVADKYKIKKVIDPTNFDFDLNDPTTTDHRPIRLNSTLKSDKNYGASLKRVSRYFKFYQSIDNNAEIIEETQLSLWEEQRFLSYWEQSNILLKFYSLILTDQTTNQEKIYLHSLNKGKINPGCEKIFSKNKKRKQFYLLLKKVCEKYGFAYYDQPECYGQFMLSNKHTKGGFFQRLSLMLNYSPVYTTPYGEMALFSSMERTKLCYLVLKSAFKISYMNQLGWDIMTLNNDFQKVGVGEDNPLIKGGLDGACVEDRWNIYVFFTDIRLIRDYFGESVAYQIMLKGKIIIYLMAIAVPYVVFYTFEQLYPGGIAPVITSLLQTGLFAVSFGIFTMFVQQEEQRFKIQFQDNFQERVFLKNFRGPYIRNPLTDQINEFSQQTGLLTVVKSVFCIAILGILIVMFGSIFYGCRMLLLQIYEPLYKAKYTVFSVSAILSYSLYFLLGDLFKLKFYGVIVKVMIQIKNPHDEESENKLRSYFTFYYLLSLQFIPIVFFYFIQPLSGNSCYQDCYNQYLNYVYARFSFNLAFALIKLISVFFFTTGINQLKKIQKALASSNHQAEEANNFQEKLKKLLVETAKQSEKEVYEQQLAKDIVALFSYCFYCTQYPLAGVIAFLYSCTIYVTTRVSLMNINRRPVNKSNSIIPFSKFCSPIYFFGLLANCWVNTFLLNYVERYYTFLFNWAPKPINRQTTFLIKIVATIVLMIFFTVLGIIARYISAAYSNQIVWNRQRNKYKQYIQNVRKPKTKQNRIKELQPLKVIFRTYNPDLKNQELLKKQIGNVRSEFQENLDHPIPPKHAKQPHKTVNKQKNKMGSHSDVRLVHTHLNL